MSTLSTKSVAHSSIKKNASSTTSKKALTHRKCPARISISPPQSPAPFNDFILFPTDEAIDNDACDRRRERSQRVKRELVADGLLPATDNDHDGGEVKQLTPLERAAKRRGMSDHDAMAHCNEAESRRKEMKMPPAPSPPRLDTPDLDDIDDDHWSCCNWNESNVQSYIAASKKNERYVFISLVFRDWKCAHRADSYLEIGTNAQNKTA